jgi:hypothetical protein
MKTLFRTFRFPLLPLIAIIVVLAIRGLAQPTPAPTPCPDPQDMLFILEIGKGNHWAPLLDPNGDAFDHAMNAITKGQYNIHLVDGKNHTKDYCKHGLLSGSASIKTDKITTSEVARRAQVQGSAANDPNVMYKIASPDPGEITKVLSTLSQ